MPITQAIPEKIWDSHSSSICELNYAVVLVSKVAHNKTIERPRDRIHPVRADPPAWNVLHSRNKNALNLSLLLEYAVGQTLDMPLLATERGICTALFSEADVKLLRGDVMRLILSD